MNKIKLNKIFGIIIIATIYFVFSTQNSFALGSSNTVPINTDQDMHTKFFYEKLKTLDRVAVQQARKTLYDMQEVIVTWINKGFDNSSSYLSDPQKAMDNIAKDQTESFTKTQLNSACEPIKEDVVKSLNNKNSKDKYACTAGSPAAVKEFLDGDFSMGGWDTFASIALEPQNNPSSLYLQAQDDLRTQILQKQDALNTDLDRGSGFRTFSVCNDVGRAEGYDYNDPDMTDNLSDDEFYDLMDFETDEKYTSSDDKNGVTHFKECLPATPAALVAGAAIQQFNMGSQELLAVQDINTAVSISPDTNPDIIAVKFAQRVTEQSFQRAQVKSIASTTRSTSSGSANTTPAEATKPPSPIPPSDIEANKARAAQAKTYYDQAVSTLTATNNTLNEAEACYTALKPISNNNYNSLLSAQIEQRKRQAFNLIDKSQGEIARKLDPVAGIPSKQIQVNNINNELKNFKLTNTSTDPNNIDQVVNDSVDNNQYYLNNLQVTEQDVKDAKAAYEDAAKISQDSKAGDLLSQCRADTTANTNNNR